MKRKYVFDENKYHVKESTSNGCITIIVTPKKRNCIVCSKSFESTGSEILFWKDDKKNQRNGWFCKTHYSLYRKYFNESKRLV